MDMIKIAMIGLAGVALALLFGQQKREYGIYIGLATAVLILLLSADRLEIVMDSIQEIENALNIDSAMIRILIKMIGITYVAEFAVGICRDAGFSALGSQIEMFAKLSIMAVSVPVLLALIETVESVLS